MARQCEQHGGLCSTIREMRPGRPCDCSECVAYREELLDQYEGERGTWGRIIEDQRHTIETLKQKYNDLLFEVQTKHPGESRHQTAQRYIRQAETHEDHAQAMVGKGDTGGTDE